MVVAEVALTVVLLTGAALTIRSLASLERVDPGFDTKRLLAFVAALPPSRYDAGWKVEAFLQNYLGRLESIPGVESASGSDAISLFSRNYRSFGIAVEGREAADPGEKRETTYNSVSPGWFAALKIPVRRGRAFTDDDTRDSLPVAVINETAARRFFADEDPIGHRIKVEAIDPRWWTVVGVVGDVRRAGLDADVQPQMFTPFSQSSYPVIVVWVRAKGDPTALAGDVRAQLRELDPDVPAAYMASLDTILARSLAGRRLHTALLSAFAALAAVLAGVGIYGVVSYTVSQRVPEIGVRVALGARPRDVVRLVMGQGTALVLKGLAIGAVAAFALARVTTSLLFETGAADPATVLAAPLLLLAVAMLATYVPARRAMRVDPVRSLRQE
jgi:putative ABC transport system permease protein